MLIAAIGLGLAQSGGVVAVDAQPAMASVSTPPLRLNPPLDRDLQMTISDRRLMPDGSTALFTITHLLRFSREGSVLIATMERRSVACDGPTEMCARFRDALSPGIGSVRRFAVGADGAVALIAGANPVAAGAGHGAGVDPATVARSIEQQRPGSLSAEDVVEAVRFAGRVLVAGAQVSAGNDQLMVQSVGNGSAEIEAEEWGEPVPGVRLHRVSQWTVDMASGLVLRGRSTSWRQSADGAATATPTGSQPAEQWLGERLWTLDWQPQ